MFLLFVSRAFIARKNQEGVPFIKPRQVVLEITTICGSACSYPYGERRL
jgi:hypothetical protein